MLTSLFASVLAAASASEAAQATARAAAHHSWAIALVRWEMWPLWALSMVLVAMILDRRRALRRERILDEPMFREVADLVGSGKVAEAEQRARASATVIGQAWAQGLHEYQLGGADLKEALTASSLLALKPLKRNLQGMASIGLVGPLFGLLGTVLGMIVVFSNLSATGGAEKAALAGGIAMALYATAGGLLVAIPAILCGRYFQARLVAMSEEVEAHINRVSYRLTHHRHQQQGT